MTISPLMSTFLLDGAGVSKAALRGWGADVETILSALDFSSNTYTVTAHVTQAELGGFWPGTGPGAYIARFDRMLIGAATANTGALNNTGDWLETQRGDTINNAQLGVLSRIGQPAIVGGSRTSDFTTAGSEGCQGGSFWAINDNATQLQTAYAIYAEAWRGVGAGTTHGLEANIVNFGSEVSVGSYGIYDYTSGLASGLWIASGGGHTPNDASVGLFFVNNTARFKKGIVFGATALEGTDGTGTGSAVAIEVARGQYFQFDKANGGQAAILISDVGNSGPLQKVLSSDLGTLFRNSNDKSMLRIDFDSSYVNGISVLPKATGNSPILQATGDDTNINLLLKAQGSGDVRLDSTAGTNSASVVTVGGTQTLSAKSFSDTVVVSGSASFFLAAVLESTNADANAGPYMVFRRTSASPANNDIGGTFIWQFRNASNAQFNGAAIDAVMTDTTAGSEDVAIRITTSANGANNNACITLGGGVQVGSPTGGDKGAGTLNATAVYDDNTLLTDYVFDRFAGVDHVGYSARVQAKADALDATMFDPEAYAAYWKQHRRLWGMPDLSDCVDGIVKDHSLGSMTQMLWQTVELQAIHIEALRERIERFHH